MEFLTWLSGNTKESGKLEVIGIAVFWPILGSVEGWRT